MNSNKENNVKSIPVKEKDNRILRVAAYCRVSTHDQDQLNSLNFQKWYYGSYINEQPGWELAEIYEDIGSGTQINGRTGFQQMIKDCDAGKIDLILTKSIMRFARNTVDSLKTIRQLKETGIGIIFDEEHVNTLTEPSEFFISVLSAYSQNESYSKSKDIRFGLEQTFMNSHSMYYQRTS